MKLLLSTALVLLAAATSLTSAWARSNTNAVKHAATVSVFRLSVDGDITPGDTFWVAYGPLAGKWGIIQLHAASSRLYMARATLPRGRSVFSYIQGKGVMQTRLGAVPGNPVTTIRQIGPVSASGTDFPLVVWHEPIG
jgi:hypothetical protein